MLRVAEHWSGTDTGRQRRANEDSLLVRSPLFVVADGMGGAQAGEVASRVAVDVFKGGIEDPSDPQRSLAAHVRDANARINDLSHRSPEHAGMGTTITAAYVGEQEVSVAHVGDSRAYCLRDGELLRLTDDHSLVDELIRQGKLTPEEAEEHPQRSVITRALGPEASVEVDTRSFMGRPGDVYLLCSDGLTTMVGEPDLARVLLGNPHLRDAGEALIAAANRAGGRDNITVVLWRLERMPSSAEGEADGHVTMTGLEGVGSEAQPLELGGAALTPQAPSNATTQTAPQPVAPRRPRRATRAPESSGRARSGRRMRRLGALLAVVLVLGAIGAGAWLALQSVYFIGTDQRGLVTIFRGVPYELPGAVKLYSRDYTSGVSASTLSPSRRQTLLDHSLRSEGDAADLIRKLELGELSER
jgi:PPM family protein phosphatase